MRCGLLTIAALAGCAVTQPAGIDPTPDPEPTPGQAPAPADTATPPSHDLRGARDVARLCEVLRDEAGMVFDGNEVQRARARDVHQQRRIQAAESPYVVLVPASGFDFRRYELSEKRLIVDTGGTFVLADGVELMAADPDAALAFEVAPEAAEVILKDHAAGRVALRLAFRPARSDLRKDICVRLSGGGIVKLPVDVLGYALLGPDGTSKASSQSGELAEDVSGPVRTPEVKIEPPRTGDQHNVSDATANAVIALGPTLLSCYEKALKRRPALRGRLVLDVRVTGDGRIDSPRMEMSSLRDDALVSCVVERVSKARLGGVSGSMRLSLPISFRAREDP